jgi:MFS transporter, MHS family, citrate/tricarballylate:H+ symporter
MLWPVADPSPGRLISVFLLYSAWFGLYYGAMTPLLAEVMPREVRTTGYSFAFVTATAVIGGFTPAISTFLIQLSGNRAAPALWLVFAASVSLCAVWLLPSLISADTRLRPAPAE